MINAGDGITVTGVGTATSPYEITASPPGFDVEDENVGVQTDTTTLNFTGAGVTATAGVAGEAVITIPGGGGTGGGIAGVNAVQQVFAVPGSATWTKLGSLLYVMVEMVGGGGGSGGCQATGAGEGASSGAGGGGGYSRKVITASALGATETVTVGAGGAAGGNNAAGGTGGTSTFGSHCTCTGGSGSAAGTSTPSTVATLGGAGGTGTDGDLNIPGQAGGIGQVLVGQRTYQAHGGNSHFGFGGRPGRDAVGNPGGVYGAGGGGSTSGGSAAAKGGAAGAQGIVIVTSYVTI